MFKAYKLNASKRELKLPFPAFVPIEPDLILTQVSKPKSPKARFSLMSFIGKMFGRLVWLSLGFIMGLYFAVTVTIIQNLEPPTVREFYNKEKENFNDSKTFRHGDSTFYGLGFRELRKRP